MMACHHFGVLIHAGIPYLHQDDGGKDCLGQNLNSPFTLELPVDMVRLKSPHAMDLTASPPVHNLPPDFLNNALVDVFLPKPNLEAAPQVVFIRNKKMEPFSALRKLAELCSLDFSSTVIFEKERESAYYRQLKLTNLGPLSLVGISVENSFPIYTLTELARISFRNLVLAGHPDIPLPAGVRDLTDSYHALVQIMEELPPLNLKICGAEFFRRYMKMYYEEHQPK